MTDFSIIIATKNYPDQFKTLLESLSDARARYKGKTEVIIIDDSDSSNKGLIHDAAIKFGCRIHYYKGNASHKKNKGAEMAAYGAMIFLDADVSVRADLFAYYNEFFEKGCEAVAGPVIFSGGDSFLWNSVNALPYMKTYSMPLYADKLAWASTANFAITKKAFIKVDFLDEDIEPAGEDNLLGISLKAKSIEIVSAKEAIVYKSRDKWLGYKEVKKRIKKHAKSKIPLIIKNSQLVMERGLNRNLMYFLMILLSSVACLIFLNPYMLIVGAAYYLFENILIAFFVRHKDEFIRTSFFEQLLTEHFMHIIERAYIFECIKQKRPGLISKRIVYYDKQAYGAFKYGRVISLVQYMLTGLVCLSLIALALFI